MYRILILLLFFFTSQMVFSLSTKLPGQLTICAYSEFKPIIYGHGQGYEAFVMRKIAKQLGLKAVFYSEATYDLLWTMPSKPYTVCDVALGGFSKNKAREQQGAVFSYPTLYFKQSLLVRKADVKKYRQIKDFAGSRIGVVPGTTGALYAIQRIKEAGLNPEQIIVYYPSESALLPALSMGAIDAIARGEIGNDYQSKENPNLVTILKQDFHESFRIVVDSHNPELLRVINQSIRKLKQKQEINFTTWS